ncbi:MAG: haloacid dehalogenase, partial [Candidatus Puniceispirillaceae bacterium]
MFKAVLFDAYGTLLDVDAAAAQLARTGRFPQLQECWPELAAIWRSRQLNYSWLRSLSRSYKPFWEITADA